MRKTLLAVLFLLILIAAGTYAHLTIYLPQKQLLEQRIAPLVDAFIEEGYPKQTAREKALAFDSLHSDWAINNQYNQSVIEYAVLLDRFPQLLVVEDGGMDENEWGLVDYLTSLKHQQLIPSDIMNLVPQNYTREVFSSLGNRTLSYVLSDGVVSGAEANALSYLQNFEAYPTQRRLIEFGLENSTIAWIDLLSSLDNQTFASYALRSRLCIGDKELTPLEIKFLKNPENHSLQLIEEYLTKLDEKYPQLVSELKKLPEHQSSNKVKVVEALEDIVTLALQGEPYENPEDRFDPQKITRAREVWEAFDLMLKGGTPDQRDFGYPVPSYNTELQCLYWLAEQNEFKDKDTLAQAIAMTHGLFVTMGTEEVRKAVYKDINEFLEFGRSTSELQKALGLPYNLEDYPLEAKVCWAWRGNIMIYTFSPLNLANQILQNKRLDMDTYEWNFVSSSTLSSYRRLFFHRFVSFKSPIISMNRISQFFSRYNWETWPYEKGESPIAGNVQKMLEHYLSTGKAGPGRCGDKAAFVGTIAKSMGISTNTVWVGEREGSTYYGPPHFFEISYDPSSLSWKAPSYELNILKDYSRPLMLAIHKPPLNRLHLTNKFLGMNAVLNNECDLFYREKHHLSHIKRMLTRGISTSLMKQILLECWRATYTGV